MKFSKFLFSIFLFLLLSQIFCLGFSLSAQPVLAAEKCANDDCPPATEVKNGAYRLPINIPGVGKTCTYEVKNPDDSSGKTTITKTCAYMPADQDLRHWIVAVYKFAVGIAVALATLMIMVGGFEWILAAGNSQRLGNARETIIASVSGLVVALASYVLLNTLSPRLVQFEDITPEAVGTIAQASNWCKDIPGQRINNDGSVSVLTSGQQTRFAAATKDANKTTDGIIYNPWLATCGYQYNVSVKDTNGNFKKVSDAEKGGGCSGHICKDKEGEKVSKIYNNLCLDLGASTPYCVNIQKYCESLSSSDCENLNTGLVEWGSSCKKVKIDNGTDKCAYGPILVCAGERERVACTALSQAEDICWQKGEDNIRVPKNFKQTELTVWNLFLTGISAINPNVQILMSKLNFSCSDDPDTNRSSGFICCRATNGTIYGSKNVAAYYKDAITYADCTKLTSPACNNIEYNKSKEACENNICKLNIKGCRWVNGSCTDVN